MSDGAAVIIGAALGAIISGLIAVLVVLLRHRIQHRRESLQETAERLAAFSSTGWVVTMNLGELARAEVDDKPHVEDRIAAERNMFLHAFARIQILDGDAVYQSATTVDRELTKLQRIARTEVVPKAEWTDRTSDLTAAVLEFQQCARQTLGSPPIQQKLPSGHALNNEVGAGHRVAIPEVAVDRK